MCIQFIGYTQQMSSEHKLKFDNFSIDKGLSQSTVLSIFNDDKGFIWIGTRNGLNKFNGYDFKIFQHKIDDSTTINGNTIYDITQDKNRQLYIATNKGLSLFNAYTNQFKNYQFPEPYQNAIPYTISIDKYSMLWLSTNRGLFLFDTKKQNFFHLSTLLTSDFEKAESASYTSYLDKNNLLWVGTNNNGLFAVDLADAKNTIKVKYNLSPEILNDIRIEGILPAKDNKLWVATYGKGLFLLNKEGLVEKHYHKSADIENQKLTHDNIRSIALDDDENLWIGTFEGLNILNMKTQQIQHVRYKKGDPNGLPHGSIRKIVKDKKGSMWIGTYFGGLSYFDKDNQKFIHYYNIPGQNTSLSFNVIGAFSEDKEGNVLVGTERGGLNVLDKRLEQHLSIQDINSETFSDMTIKSIKTTGAYTHWLGTFKQGLIEFDSKTNSFKRFPENTGVSGFANLSTSIINCLETDSDGLLWLGLDNDESIAVFDIKSEKFIQHPVAEKIKALLRNKPVKHIAFSENGDIYLSTRGHGLVHFDKQQNIVQAYQKFQNDTEIIGITDVNHTAILDDELWVSTHGQGLIRLVKEDKKLKHHIKMTNGLLSNIIYGTIANDYNSIWVMSSSGLSKIEDFNSEYTIKNYNYASGFPIQEINEGAFFKSKSGDILVGGNNGYVVFNPENLTDNSYIPQVILSDLKISNKSVTPNDSQNVLDKPIYETKEITLNYKQSIFTIEFALLNYLSPENNRYAYKLEGFDEDWIDAGNNRTATYTNLKSDNYTFMVKGANNDNIWTELPTMLKIHVLPPPWKTWWAYLIYSLLIIIGLLIIRQNAVKGEKMRLNLKLEKIEKEKLKELHQLKLKYFTDISHEFRTPLTLITSPLEELLESKKGNKWLRKKLKTMYYSSKRLLHLVDQILEFREIESGNYKVNQEPVLFKDYLQQVIDSFKILADKKSIQLNFHYACLHPKYNIDKDKLDKILYNLLSNAFKFTPIGGRISLDVSSTTVKGKEKVSLKLSDTGIGINQQETNKVFKRFYKTKSQNSGSGVGLSFTKTLVEILGGTIEILKSDKNGTEFLVQLPLGHTEDEAVAQNGNFHFLKPVPLEYGPISSDDTPMEIDDAAQANDKLLIVEDTQELRNYLKDHLKKKYKVYTASHGKEALKIIKKRNINLVLSDVMMPEMDGIELCESIKTSPELSHIPIILLTAKTSYLERLEGLNVGADDYIAKPFYLKEIESRIHNILENRKRLQSKFQSLNYFEKIDVDLGSPDEKLLKKLINFLEQNIEDPALTVDTISKEIGLSRVHLFRKMKAIAGMSPSAFIKDFRMKKAKAIILKNPSASVSEVAYSVGFQDVKYFSKCFKKHFGKSPTKIRNAIDQKV